MNSNDPKNPNAKEIQREEDRYIQYLDRREAAIERERQREAEKATGKRAR